MSNRLPLNHREQRINLILRLCRDRLPIPAELFYPFEMEELPVLIYVVHDIVADTYSTPFFAFTPSHLVRTIRDLYDSCTSLFEHYARTPHDYRIYQIGEYNIQNGTIIVGQHQYVMSMTSVFANPATNRSNDND